MCRMWLLIIFSFVLDLALCQDTALNITPSSLALPRNGFIPTNIPSITQELHTPVPPSELPTPAKLSEDRIDTNEIYKTPNFMENATPNIGIPLLQQTHTQNSAISQATMQMAQTIISQIKNQALNQQSSEPEPSIWKYPQEQLAPSFSQYSASTEPTDNRRFAYHEVVYHEPHDYKHYDYKSHDYKYDDYKHDHYKPHDYKYDDYKHDHYKPYDYKYDQAMESDYHHHHHYHDHDDKLKDLAELFKDFKDDAKKASQKLGKKIARETKDLIHKLGPIAPIAGTLLVGSLAAKLLTLPNGSGYNYFNKFNTTFPSSSFPMITFNGRKKRSYGVGKSLVLVFDQMAEVGKRKEKRSVSGRKNWKNSMAIAKSHQKHYQLVLLFDDKLRRGNYTDSKSRNG